MRFLTLEPDLGNASVGNKSRRHSLWFLFVERKLQREKSNGDHPCGMCLYVSNRDNFKLYYGLSNALWRSHHTLQHGAPFVCLFSPFDLLGVFDCDSLRSATNAFCVLSASGTKHRRLCSRHSSGLSHRFWHSRVGRFIRAALPWKKTDADRREHRHCRTLSVPLYLGHPDLGFFCAGRATGCALFAFIQWLLYAGRMASLGGRPHSTGKNTPTEERPVMSATCFIAGAAPEGAVYALHLNRGLENALAFVIKQYGLWADSCWGWFLN